MSIEATEQVITIEVVDDVTELVITEQPIVVEVEDSIAVEVVTEVTVVEVIDDTPTIEVQADTVEVLEIVVEGGSSGSGGGGNGRQEIFVQQTDPAVDYPSMWWETWPDGSLRTLWVEDGAA